MVGIQRELFSSAVYRFYTLRPIQDEESCARVRRLWLAVLQRGLQDYIAQGEEAEEEDLGTLAPAREWLFSPDDVALGSFRSICAMLDIDPDRVLGHLESLDEEGLRSLRKSSFDDVY